MNEKIKDLTLTEILLPKCPLACSGCPLHIKRLGHCLLHIKPIELRLDDLESEE